MDRYPTPPVADQAQTLTYRPSQPIDFSDSLLQSITKLEAQQLGRSVQELKLQLAQQLIDKGSWNEALRLLRPLWASMTYRPEGWWDVVEDVSWKLRQCAEKTGDAGTVIAVDWELINRTFTRKPEWRYDIMSALGGMEKVEHRPAVVIRDTDVHSFLSATFAFELAEGKVGEVARAQLMVTSQAMEESAPVTMAEVKVMFEGSMRPVVLHHKAPTVDESAHASGIIHCSVVLHDATVISDSQVRSRDPRSAPFQGDADLTFPAGKSKVFEFIYPLREAGEAKAISATFSLAADLFDLEYIATFNRTIVPDVWWSQKAAKKRLVRVDPHAMNILPKPPKMDIRFASLLEQYYTNEAIKLQLDINNGEDEESVANLAVEITGDQAPAFVLKSGLATEDGTSHTAEAGSSSLELGSVARSDKTSAVIEIPPVMFPAIYDMTVQLSYHLVSDMETPISKTTTVRLLVVSPFEANYDFSPRLDLSPWPSFFSHSQDEDGMTSEKEQLRPRGLAQKWCLTTRYASFAAEALLVEDVDVEVLTLGGGIICAATKIEIPGRPKPLCILPNTIEESQFSIQTRKLSLDDRRSASLDLQLVIRWRRSLESHINTTPLPVPRLLVASSEPRVLASVAYSTIASLPLLTISYTIENPSMHFLTFGVVMNPSENFAFSGVKQGTVQLLPLSRRTIRVRVLPSVRGEWIRPAFVVRDRYFQKILRVIATEGMRSDKDGVLVWVPPLVEEGDGGEAAVIRGNLRQS